MMNSRERLSAALNHVEPDRVPVNFGGTAVTGMHVSAVTRLRRAVPGDKQYCVKVAEPYQMLGELDDVLLDALEIDVTGLPTRKNMFGMENRGWTPFTLFDGTEVLVPGSFNVREDERGAPLIFPEGDVSAPPSGRMPKGFYFFDARSIAKCVSALKSSLPAAASCSTPSTISKRPPQPRTCLPCFAPFATATPSFRG
jgi:hypothetical protein